MLKKKSPFYINKQTYFTFSLL